MKQKQIGWAALICFVVSAVPFWLWKLYIITGTLVHVLIWMFILLFGPTLILGFAFGCQVIMRTTRNWIGRGFQLVLLFCGTAYVALMAALAMNFVGQ